MSFFVLFIIKILNLNQYFKYLTPSDIAPHFSNLTFKWLIFFGKHETKSLRLDVINSPILTCIKLLLYLPNEFNYGFIKKSHSSQNF